MRNQESSSCESERTPSQHDPRVARACCVTNLLVENASRRPLHALEDALGDKLADLVSLDDNKRALALSVIDALTTNAKLRAITGSAS